jgi:hypothetical protein
MLTDADAKVRVGRFAFFRLRMQRSLRWLEVRVSEARFSGGLPCTRYLCHLH